MEKTGQIPTIYAYTKDMQNNLQNLKENIREALEKKGEFRDVKRLKNMLVDYNNLYQKCLQLNEFKNVKSLLPVSTDFLYYEGTKNLRSIIYSRENIRETFLSLDKVERGCAIIIGVLEYLLSSKFSPEETDKLSSLKREVEEIKGKLGEQVYLSENIQEAIKEYESGHFLAAGLIASRVIRYVIDKIPGKDDEEKVDKLLKMNIIEKERKDEQEAFLHASRLARNILSHMPSSYPKPEESMDLVTHAIKFLRYIVNLGS